MQIQAKVERPSYCFIVDFCLPPYHSLSDINSPCLPTVLSILPSFSNSPKMRLYRPNQLSEPFSREKYNGLNSSFSRPLIFHGALSFVIDWNL